MKSFLSLDFFVFIHPLLIVLVAGIMLLLISSCVRVTHRLPPIASPPVTINSPLATRCALVQKLKRQFRDGEIPEELRQAERICREAGL